MDTGEGGGTVGAGAGRGCDAPPEQAASRRSRENNKMPKALSRPFSVA